MIHKFTSQNIFDNHKFLTIHYALCILRKILSNKYSNVLDRVNRNKSKNI